MYTTVGDQNIYYQKVGRGKNLIFLHGWKQDSSSFWGLVDYLRNDYTIWLIDLPGFGRSDNPKKSFTVSDYAEVIAEFIRLNKIKDGCIVGHSVGGRIAIKLAYLYPNLTDKLILEDSAGIRPEETKKAKLLYPFVKLFHYLIPNGNLKEILRHKLYSSLESDYPDVGSLKETFANIVSEDLTEFLPKIKTETLLIWGENDRAVPLLYGKRMYRLIPNSKIEVLEGVGHFPHLENPERFLYYVKDFC